MSHTLLEVLEQLVEETGLARLCIEVGDATDSDTLIDSQRALGIGGVPKLEIGCPAFITSLETGGTPIGEHSYIDATPPAATGIISVLPAFTTLTKSAQTFQLWHKDVGHIDNVLGAINRGLTKWCHRWALIPLTRLTDGDMEASGTTDWSASSSPAATLAKGSPVFPDAPARQRLSITATLSAATEFAYAKSSNINGTPGETYNLAVMMRGSGSTYGAYVRVKPLSGSYLDLEGDADEAYNDPAYAVKRWTFTLPSSGLGGFGVYIGVTGSASAGISTRFVWVAVWRQNDQRIPLQARVDSQQKIGRVFELVRGGGEEEEWGESSLREIPRIVHGPGRGTQPMQIEIPAGGTGPYFYEEWQPYSEFTKTSAKWVMTDTTDAPLEWAVAAGGYELYNWLSRNWRQGMVQRMPEPGMPGEKNPWTSAWRDWAKRFRPLHMKFLEQAKSCRT